MDAIKAQILNKYGITETQLISKTRENKLARIEFVRLAVDQGYLDKQIAKELNRSRSAISRIARAL